MGRYGDMDFKLVTKRGFLLGVGLFAVGILGEVAGNTVYGSLPAWENTLFLDMEIVGVLLMLLVPFVFGIVLPLTD